MRAGTHALVEDDPAAFAAAVTRLLCDDAARDALARAAREHAARHFGQDACYGAVLDILRQHGAAARPARAAEIPVIARARLRAALDWSDGDALVVWGNGSHTRLLVPLLASLGGRVRCIVDNLAAEPSTSAEGISVVPGREFRPLRGDLIVLSSQTFEEQMWEATAPYRDSGTAALGLYHYEYATPGLVLPRRLRRARHERRVVEASRAPHAA
jgi:hypothetical protein